MKYKDVISDLIIKDGYKEFSQKLIPGSKPILGVPIPQLRKVAKDIYKNGYKEFLDGNTFDYLESCILQGFVIANIKDKDESIFYCKKFIPIISDWCSCDTFCSSLKICRKHQEEFWEFIVSYANKDGEFYQRFVAVCLMSHFLDEKYCDRALKIVDNLKNDGYYCKMGVAWFVATYMAKHREKCFNYLKKGNNTLDDWTYNKSITKMIESFRVTKEDKVLLRQIKRN